MKTSTIEYLLKNRKELNIPTDEVIDLTTELTRRSIIKVTKYTKLQRAELKNIDYTIHNIIAEGVNKYFGVEINNKRRFKQVVQARKYAAYFMCKYTSDTYENIGLYIGGFDHATVMHHKRDIENFLDIKDHLTIKTITDITEDILPPIKEHKEKINEKRRIHSETYSV